jgi:hypothetical protein
MISTSADPLLGNEDVDYKIEISNEISDIYGQTLGLDTEWTVKLIPPKFYASLKAPIDHIMVTRYHK